MIKSTIYSAGYDLFSWSDFELNPGERTLIWAMNPSTGKILNCRESKLLPSPEYVGLVCPRSGLAIKHGITVLNAPGIIDFDYEGDLGVILINLGQQRWSCEREDKIAQLVVTKRQDLVEAFTNKIINPEKRKGGFGSTGK